MEDKKSRSSKFSPSPQSSLSSVKFGTRSSSSFVSPLWKERQLRDYCKSNGLCMYCGDKYDKAHATSCTKRPQAQVNALVINDLNQPLSDEVLTQLAVEDSLQEEFEHLSLNALAGTAQREVLQLRSLVQNKVLLILLDSGSSHSFINQSFVDLLELPTVPSASRAVKLANGQVLYTNRIIPDLEWWYQGHTISTTMQVLEFGAYDAILGYDWLKRNSPMTCNWADHSVEFCHQGHMIKLQGVPAQPLSLSAVSADSVVKWHKGNDVWALAALQCGDSPPSSSPPPELTSFLSEFADVFQKPTTLPPHRTYDHFIPLFPDAIPVNSRPYIYSPLHKDEIERQIKELLHAGLITPSSSPFASPVLLVQKKDGTWRFCVDYRKLNDLTIKNRFPLPIIEEILDELFGSKFFTKLDMTSGYHQIRMLPIDEPKTAFKMHHGHF